MATSSVNKVLNLYTQQRFREAIELGESIIHHDPRRLHIFSIIGAAYTKINNNEKAAECYSYILKIKPDDPDAHYNLGNSFKSLGRHNEAIASYLRALNFNPEFAEAHNNLGSTLKDLGRFDEAIECFMRVLKIKPDHSRAHYNLAQIYGDLGRRDEAIACYKKSLGINPHFATAHYNLASMLQECGRQDEAIASYKRALHIKPDFVEALNNLGNIFKELGRHAEAIDCYKESLKIDPGSCEVLFNLGVALVDVDQRNLAIGCHRRALQINPNFADAHYALGNIFRDLDQPDEAIGCYDNAIRCKPEFALAMAGKLYLQANTCDWKSVTADNEAVASLGISGGTVGPFGLLFLEDNPARQRIRSERYASDKYPPHELPHPPVITIKPPRLRIGYFAADFHNHPSMRLMARLFELHDRDRFVVHAFSFGPEKNDAMRVRVKGAFDVFHDVRSLGDREVAKLARSESIDIAIDINGYTRNGRMGIFAYRAAPVQISYLGYPGTTGAPYIDYIISDNFIISGEMNNYYSEKIIYMPNTYQANDNTIEIDHSFISRRDHGLPDQGFVFCCFNNNRKIRPREYEIWMRLLRSVEGSVLWLLKSDKKAELNLRREAQERGIDPARLIFAEKLPLPAHLARHRLADLFLDTFIYNAHTTASDALWAGLPVVTKLGRGFAARVTGSLLTAVGLPELITNTDDEYERVALQLATDAGKLRAIRQKLAENRNVKPLFDSELFTKHIESAYHEAYRRYFDRIPADNIIVKH